jgi:hypothetical protein
MILSHDSSCTCWAAFGFRSIADVIVLATISSQSSVFSATGAGPRQ